MEEIISKEELNELMKIKGEVRGMAVKSYGDYILKEKGKAGLEKLEKMVAKAGFPIKYRKVKPLAFYPLRLEGITLLAIKRLFNFDDKKIQEMGRFQAKSSIIIRFLAGHFFPFEKATKVVPKMWRSYYTVGNLKTTEFDEDKRYIILRLENFCLLPIHCQDLIGYFPAMLQMIVGSKATCEETRCVYWGDKYHEFLLKW